MNVETDANFKNTCAGKIDVPTDKEISALNAMRSIKSRVKAIKENIKRLNELRDEKSRNKALALEKDLEGLKTEWTKWQQKLKEAVRERMIILGHEE